MLHVDHILYSTQLHANCYQQTFPAVAYEISIDVPQIALARNVRQPPMEISLTLMIYDCLAQCSLATNRVTFLCDIFHQDTESAVRLPYHRSCCMLGMDRLH